MSREIIGICVVRNEDMYIKHALRNIANFCDKIRVVDNHSSDKTVDEVRKCMSDFSNISLEFIDDVKKSHSLVQEYIGKDKWVFLVDGDEMYDPKGLSILRPKILEGKYQKYWMLRGYFYHLIDLEINSSEYSGEGYLAPPAKDPNKLYNFSMLKKWDSDEVTPICHPLTHEYKDSKYGPLKNPGVKKLHKNNSWETCLMRCVHTRMIQRSSIESLEKEEINTRMNMSDNIKDRGSRGGNFRKKYRIGKKVKKDVSQFFV
jgi:glycosyltransferase involved in cell wall biosynthesis